jgi:hypothetical protein
MATTIPPPSSGQLPTGKSPFTRVAQLGTHDDLLGCAATLCGKTMEEVKKMAVTLGMKANGPFYLDEGLFRKILFNLSNFAVSEYKDFTTVEALPPLCVLMVDFATQAEGDVFRHVVFHHVKASPEFPSLSYVIDVAPWVDAKQQVTTDLSHLKMEPAWYLEITQRPNPAGTKAK